MQTWAQRKAKKIAQRSGQPYFRVLRDLEAHSKAARLREALKRGEENYSSESASPSPRKRPLDNSSLPDQENLDVSPSKQRPKASETNARVLCELSPSALGNLPTTLSCSTPAASRCLDFGLSAVSSPSKLEDNQQQEKEDAFPEIDIDNAFQDVLLEVNESSKTSDKEDCNERTTDQEEGNERSRTTDKDEHNERSSSFGEDSGLQSDSQRTVSDLLEHSCSIDEGPAQENNESDPEENDRDEQEQRYIPKKKCSVLRFAEKIVSAWTRHNISYKAAEDILNIVNEELEELLIIKQERGRLPCMKTLRRIAEGSIHPQIDLLFRHKRLMDEEDNLKELLVKNREVRPVKDFPPEDWDLVYEISFYSVSSLVSLFSCHCIYPKNSRLARSLRRTAI